jgi:putative protease
MPSGLRPGTLLYRNNDQAFQQQLAKPSAVRKIPLRMQLSATPDGFALRAGSTTVSVVMEHQMAQTPQHENIVRQLSKLGGTPYECAGVDIDPDFPYFIPSSTLSELRRMLYPPQPPREGGDCHPQPLKESGEAGALANRMVPLPFGEDGRGLNISNRLSRQFYRQQGLTEPEPAFELRDASDRVPLMQCRYCLRHALGYCTKSGERLPFREPLFLRLSDGRRFRLEFDCRQCQMNVYAAHS